jgi:hypothetical protein
MSKSKPDSLRGGRNPRRLATGNPETALAPAAEADRLAVRDHNEAGYPRAAGRVDGRIPARIPTLLQWPHAVAVQPHPGAVTVVPRALVSGSDKRNQSVLNFSFCSI